MNIYIDGSYGSTASRIQGGLGICFFNSGMEHLSISVMKDQSKYVNFDNQAMEAMSMYIALWLTEYCTGVTIYSDCQHVVNCLTEWYDKFQNNGWITSKNKAIAQRGILIECGKMVQERSKKTHVVQIEKVQAHSGIPGNVIADQCAYSAMTNGNIQGDVKRIELEYTTTIGNSVARNAELTAIKQFITVTQTDNHNNLIERQCPRLRRSTRTIMSSHSLQDIVDEYEFPPPSVSDELAPQLPYGRKSKFIDESELPELVGEIALRSDTPVALEENTDLISEENIASSATKHSTLLTEGNYLFVACFQHNGMVVVRYPDNDTCKVKQKFKISDISTIAFTTCKDCIVSVTESTDTKEIVDTAGKRAKSMRQMRIRPSVLQGSSIYNCALMISHRTPTILSENDIVKYIPITDITKVCNNKCRVSSIDINGQTELPYLEFGFI